jgi:hypothetical protein
MLNGNNSGAMFSLDFGSVVFVASAICAKLFG